jgi:hypothetical protein
LKFGALKLGALKLGAGDLRLTNSNWKEAYYERKT